MIPETPLNCDQAIFTSVRSPLGEGYRITAASKGVRPEEKQVITRRSPSHEGLCAVPTTGGADQPTFAMAFYPLPTGRLCVALSCPAGAEHTGRGGQRVYTHNVLLDAATFALCGHNPFLVWRAMVKSGLNIPQLKAHGTLPALTLSLGAIPVAPSGRPHPSLHSACRRHLLNALLGSRNLILNMADHWIESAELLLLGVPGPLRAARSVAAGLKFSLAHGHHLHVLCDDQGKAKTRSTGQAVEFVQPDAIPSAETSNGAWVSFVDRHWSAGCLTKLAGRTGCAFPDTGPNARERFGKLFNLIDDVPTTAPEKLLVLVGEHLSRETKGLEQTFVSEFLASSSYQMKERFARMKWAQAAECWTPLFNLWRRSGAGRAFAQPLLEVVLGTAKGEELLSACETAADLPRFAQDGGAAIDPGLIDGLWHRLATWLEQTPALDHDRLQRLCQQWKCIRPQCAIIDRVAHRLAFSLTVS